MKTQLFLGAMRSTLQSQHRDGDRRVEGRTSVPIMVSVKDFHILKAWQIEREPEIWDTDYSRFALETQIARSQGLELICQSNMPIDERCLEVRTEQTLT